MSYRTPVGGYKPPPPRPSWWARRRVALGRWWQSENIIFDRPGPGRNFIDVRAGWVVSLILSCAITIVFTVSLAAESIQCHYSPCVNGKIVSGLVAGHRPDGTAVQVQTKWCAEYKPGREGEEP